MKKVLLISPVFFLLASCTIEYYPSTYNAPLFTDMEQFEGNISWGTSGYDAQIAYAPINHFGFMATGSYADRNSSSEFDDNNDNQNVDKDFHKHLHGEAGLGYFTKLGSKGVFEFYGGYGRGRTEGYSDLWDNLDYDKALYSKYFIQPEIGISNQVFEGAFVSRFSAIDMKSKVNDYQTLGVYFEPGIVLKVGYKYVKYYTQFGFSVPINADAEYLKYNHSFFNISVGLNFSFGGYNNK